MGIAVDMRETPGGILMIVDPMTADERLGEKEYVGLMLSRAQNAKSAAPFFLPNE